MAPDLAGWAPSLKYACCWQSKMGFHDEGSWLVTWALFFVQVDSLFVECLLSLALNRRHQSLCQNSPRRYSTRGVDLGRWVATENHTERQQPAIPKNFNVRYAGLVPVHTILNELRTFLSLEKKTPKPARGVTYFLAVKDMELKRFWWQGQDIGFLENTQLDPKNFTYHTIAVEWAPHN